MHTHINFFQAQWADVLIVRDSASLSGIFAVTQSLKFEGDLTRILTAITEIYLRIHLGLTS